MEAMKDKLLLRFAIRETMGTIILGVALFWSAGTLAWWPAWAVVAITFVWTIATGVVIMRTNPDLLAERLGPRKGGKSWDTAIMGVIGMTTLARLVVAGLDRRFGWSGEFPAMLQIAALVAAGTGYALVVWATGSNAYFSQIVRIQTEREHAVASGGPYRFVRHPGYVGSILYELSLPLLLASWWAFLLGVLNAGLFVVRTALEDRDLQNELDGYKAYTERVRYRLLPGIW
jgi:protein-S-isoprenylcysteine O-methyltransferase Ste14